MNAFFKTQFNYCPIAWVFHTRSLNNKINRLHECCLRILYNDKCSNFKELLAVEMLKLVHGISPEIMNDVFQIRNNTHLI